MYVWNMYICTYLVCTCMICMYMYVCMYGEGGREGVSNGVQVTMEKWEREMREREGGGEGRRGKGEYYVRTYVYKMDYIHVHVRTYFCISLCSHTAYWQF